MSSLGWPDVLIMGVYFVGITWAGVYFAGRTKGTEDYFLGGRSIPAWVIGISMIGTSISSISFLGFPGDAYMTTWLRLLPNLMLPVAVLVAAYFFLPFFRHSPTTSAYEYLEARFGPKTRLYAASAFIIAQIFRIAMILYLLSQLLVVVTGWSTDFCIIVAGVFVAFYTIVGGIEAVIWTDVAQTIIMVLGCALCFAVVIVGLPGGFGQLFSAAAEAGKMSFAEVVIDNGVHTMKDPSWSFSLGQKTALMMLLWGLGQFLAEYSSNQNVVQRYCASKSMKDARRAMLICAVSSVPIWVFLYLLGTGLWVYFQVHADETAAAILAGDAKPEQILPHFVIHYLPMGVSGLVLSAVVAAAMSSIDSSINAVSTVGVVDLYRRHLAPGREDSHYLNVARGIATVTGVLMVVLAMVIARDGSQTFQDTATVVYALTAGGLLGLFMLGFMTTKGNGYAVGAGIVATLAFTALMTCKQLGVERFAPYYPPIDTYYTSILGHLAMFVIGYTLGALVARPKQDLTNLTIWTQDGKPIQ
ncbi:MAG: sodium/solute symporter [Candidatus Hydrogenedens sp.]|nr:sodium/solute symporter [Candidatus Hydrogenedens sp.]